MECLEPLPARSEGRIVTKLGHPNMMELLRVCCTPQADEVEQYIALTGEDWIVDDVAAALYAKDGIKLVIMTDNDESEPIAVGGFDLIAPGVWQSWMICVEGAWDKYAVEITNHCNAIIENMFEQADTRRIQTLALTSREQACKWYVKGLRMTQESVAKQFGTAGEDVACFVRFREK